GALPSSAAGLCYRGAGTDCLFVTHGRHGSFITFTAVTFNTKDVTMKNRISAIAAGVFALVGLFGQTARADDVHVFPPGFHGSVYVGSRPVVVPPHPISSPPPGYVRAMDPARFQARMDAQMDQRIDGLRWRVRRGQ